MKCLFSVFALILALPVSSFASGSTVQLPLTGLTKISTGTACTYTRELNLGNESALTPIQVYGLFDGSYQLMTRGNEMFKKDDGTFAIHLFAYQEVDAKTSCPSQASLLVVR